MSKHFLAEQLEKFIDIKDIPMTLMTPRIQRMKDETQALNDQGLRQTRLYVNMAASLAQTKGEPENIRRAKAFAYHLKHIEQPIYDAEQLIGSVTGMWPVDEARNQLTYEQLKQETQQMLDEYFANRGGFNHYDNAREGQMLFAYKKGGLSFEEQANLTKFRFGSLMARDHYDANIDFQVMQKLIAEMEQHYRDAGVEFENWEIGSRIEKHFVYNYGAETMQLLRENGWNAANHTNLNYKRLVVTGIGGILERINGYLENAKSQKDKDFYTGCKIVMEAVSDYIFRYAKAAAVKAEATEEPVRRAELQEMAVVMEKISMQKPETFTEAIELVWMIQLIGNLFGGSALSLARFDQYMYPFYKHDIEAGAITVDRVFELICSLYMKLNEPKMRTVQSLAVGGICCESGEDACNDLSKLCLEAMSTLKTPYPNMSARVMPGKTPDWFYDEIMRTVKAGCGQPMVLNDAVWVPNLTSLGIPEKWARDYYNMGCTEIMIQGKDCNWTTGGLIFFPELLNAMIRKSAAEGRTYESFEEFLGEYLKLIDKQCDEAGESGKNVIHSQRERNCDPFASSLIDGCLEMRRITSRAARTRATPFRSRRRASALRQTASAPSANSSLRKIATRSPSLVRCCMRTLQAMSLTVCVLQTVRRSSATTMTMSTRSQSACLTAMPRVSAARTRTVCRRRAMWTTFSAITCTLPSARASAQRRTAALRAKRSPIVSARRRVQTPRVRRRC